MGLVIGMDEAGYGPNLGPLVISVTVWDVPGPPRHTDFWGAQAEIIDPFTGRDKSRLHVADSKQVYTPARGIANLERAVLSSLQLCSQFPTSFHELRHVLTAETPTLPQSEPWFAGCDLRLPLAKHTVRFDEITDRWQQCCRQHRIRLRTIRSDVVFTERFNRLTREFGSKGVVLSRLSLGLLRQVWNPQNAQPTFIVADKHGGRNRYGHLLHEVVDGTMVSTQQESRARSSYRVGSADIHFQTKAESHFPVALASMVSKYVREVAMTLFNRYWCAHTSGLKPTKGYPVDALRFKQDIAETQSRLGISDDVLWRER